MISTQAALLLALGLAALWLLSVRIRDASIVDVFWGPGFVLVAWTCALARDLPLDRGQWLLLLAVTLWGLRLGVYLAWRNLIRDGNQGEDRRYQAMRARVGDKFWLVSLVSVFALQGLMIFIVSLPIQAALLAGGGPWLGLVASAAIASWLVGILFETVGDLQLSRFLADPQNAGKVMDRGLWAYTRHPNYFGDFAIWWGHFGLAFALGAPWWTLVSPLIMSYLLMKVSGVPMLEKTMKRRRPEYESYIQRTSAFFPRRPGGA